MRGFSVTSIGLLLGLLVISGCDDRKTIVGNDQIAGSGRIVSQNRTAGEFSGIRVTNFATVVITQDSATSVRVEADDNIIGRVQTAVNNGVLDVGLEQGSYNNVTIRVYLSTPTLTLLESTGAANFTAADSIHTDDLTCRITGAGSIRLTGTAVHQSVIITGAGDVRNFGLMSSQCSVSISGSGNVEVTAMQELTAMIAGTGSITYDGNPPLVHQTITGVGSIRPKQ